MPDEPTSGAAPAATPVTPTAPAATITSPDALAADGNTTEAISIEAARKLRSEAEAMRKRLKAYEAAEEAAKLAALSETEKLNKQYAELQEQHEAIAAQLAESLVRQSVADLYSKFNFIDGLSAKTVADLILLHFDDIEFEEGKPTNVEKMLEKLVKSETGLVKSAQQQQAGSPQLPAMNPGRSQITQPGQAQPGRIPRLSDPGLWKT